MKICKDGRILGQNNREAGSHLGILTGRQSTYTKKGTASKSKQGENNPMYGKKHSSESRFEMSENTRGSKHPNWKGGQSSDNQKLRNQIEYRLWREAVFARDNWTCQECGERGGRLNAHHIKSFTQYPELKFAIDNGKTLCYKCHRQSKLHVGGNTL